ncbi:MAG: hypothetical protein M0R22_02995 [Dehalococcoidia bacterium]|jgi:hypothetical protein|nr:hypothetical protein [Dehalococcoidia bacterium]
MVPEAPHKSDITGIRPRRDSILSAPQSVGSGISLRKPKVAEKVACNPRGAPTDWLHPSIERHGLED